MRQRGFTLIELLVVVSIVALLISILLPALSRSREHARGVQCLSNLRQTALAAHTYVASYRGRYVPAYFTVDNASIQYTWEVNQYKIWTASGVQTRAEPGLLWQGKTNEAMSQCPSYEGSDNFGDASSYSGYDYNTSYIGYCEYFQKMSDSFPPTPIGPVIPRVNPARAEDVAQPARTALFGDGEYEMGAHKFMRAPLSEGARDDGAFSGRYAGTQGYRHLGKTNVAFCDGHAVAWRERYTEIDPASHQDKIRPYRGTLNGFLSKDNRLYDLK